MVASKTSTLTKTVTITTTKVDTEMLAERHISSCFLYSGKLLESSTNVNSHTVLNSQVWEKLEVFGSRRNFALYPSVTRLFRAASISSSTHTHSFQTQSILRSHYTASRAWTQGRHFHAQLPWKQNIHPCCTEGETPVSSALTQYHAVRLILLN